MGGARYTAEFKVEALKQITEREHGVVEVVKRLGVSDKILYKCCEKQTYKSNHNSAKT